MLFFRFCCANSRYENEDGPNNMKFSIDPNSSELVEKKLKKLKNVLVEYMHFERSTGVQNVDIIKLIEMVLNHYSENEIPKKDLQKTFNKLKPINLN
jgi:phosphoribosylformylglycinamidine (FGAM) synthase PurS component